MSDEPVPIELLPLPIEPVLEPLLPVPVLLLVAQPAEPAAPVVLLVPILLFVAQSALPLLPVVPLEPLLPYAPVVLPGVLLVPLLLLPYGPVTLGLVVPAPVLPVAPLVPLLPYAPVPVLEPVLPLLLVSLDDCAQAAPAIPNIKNRIGNFFIVFAPRKLNEMAHANRQWRSTPKNECYANRTMQSVFCFIKLEKEATH